MASWKKVLVSGSSISVNQITATGIGELDNENQILTISSSGLISSIQQGNIAGTNPTIVIEASNDTTFTSASFTTGEDLLRFSASSDHGFGFTHTTSGDTSSISLQTPQALKTTSSPSFNSLTLTGTSGDLFVNQGIHLGNGSSDFSDAIITSSGDQLEIRDNSSVAVIIDSNGAASPGTFRVNAHTSEDTRFMVSSSGKVGIGTTTLGESNLLTVSGNISVTAITASDLPINSDSIFPKVVVKGGNGELQSRDVIDIITSASTSVSSSITGTASEVEVTGTPGNVVVGLPSDVTIGNNLTVSNNLDLTGGNITVEGSISASGNITASNIRVDNDIALGGSIFSFSGFSFVEGISANLSGSTTFGSGSHPGANDIAGGGTAHQFTGSVAITGSGLTIVGGGINALDVPSTFNNIIASEITASIISSSGALFASLSNDDNIIADKVVVYDEATGQFLTTSSAAIGVNDYADLANIPTNIISASVLSSGSSQGEYDLTINGVTQDNNISSGLTTTDTPTFFSLTISSSANIGGPLTASIISSSGALFASLSLDTQSETNKTIVYEESTGKFFFTGSYGGGGITNYSDLAGLNAISSSINGSNNQGGITSSINGVSSSFDVGLTTADSPTFVGLTLTGNAQVDGNATITGDLTVNGTTTTIETTNLQIEDTFILLASGSAGDTTLNDAGIIVEQGTTPGSGIALFWDTSNHNWAIDAGGNANASDEDGNVSNDVNVLTVEIANSLGVTPVSSPTMGNDANTRKGHFYVDTSDEHGVYVYT
tara:strand:- start:88 stop:2418 length:2331 start_codon:yes stop_codon:yes gene_type:complete